MKVEKNKKICRRLSKIQRTALIERRYMVQTVRRTVLAGE
jgi:hypothetical protein